jgi:hypothetical protein
MRNIEMTSVRIIRLIVLVLMLGCLGARAIGVAQQSPDRTKPDLIPYRKGKQWGFSDASKKLIIPARYDYVERFSEGLALVALSGKNGRTDRKYGFIDKSGKEVIPLKYDSIKLPYEGLAEVGQNGNSDKLGYVGLDGTEYFEP